MVSRETLSNRIDHYAHLIFEANKTTNLVSRRLSEAEVRTLVDAHSMLLERCAHPGAEEAGGLSGRTFLDVGSGAGLPGIPIKLRHPELDTLLSESRKLRVLCLESFVRDLGLEDVHVVPGNARRALEDSGHAPFDIVTAFGVGPTLDVIRVTSPLIADRGIAYLSIPARPDATQVAQWHLEGAFNELSAEILLGVLDGDRSVLRLRR